MIRGVVYFACIAISAVALILAGTDHPVVVGLLTGLIVGLIVPFLDLLIQNHRYMRLALFGLRHWGQHVRISASYLYRIKVKDRYLLVRGQRYPMQFQPVDGVFKVSSTAQPFLDDIGAVSDDLLPIDEVSEHDLRLLVKGRNLVKFVRWYESGTCRETSPWREFYEELIQPNTLPRELFPYVLHEFIRRTFRLRYSDRAGRHELLIADVYQLLPTAAQATALNELHQHGDPNVLWASGEQIRRAGAVPGKPQEADIPITAQWVL